MSLVSYVHVEVRGDARQTPAVSCRDVMVSRMDAGFEQDNVASGRYWVQTPVQTRPELVRENIYFILKGKMFLNFFFLLLSPPSLSFSLLPSGRM
jgi:hypothetical protein